VNTPVDVAVLLFIISNQCLDNLQWFLGGGSIVEVNQRFTMHLLLQDRKISTDLFYGEGHKSLVIRVINVIGVIIV